MIRQTASSRRTLRVKPLTDSQKLQMINERLSGRSAKTVAGKYRISVPSLAAYMANHTRGAGVTA